MTKTLFGAVALAALAFAGMAGCKRSSPGAAPSVGGNLGTVDGEPITYEQFYGYLQRKPIVLAAVQGRQVQVQVADTLGIQTMRDLVQQKLLLGIAKDEGVYPTKEEVDKELASRVKQNPNYITSLEHAGLSKDDISADLLLGLASEKIQTKGVTVSVDEAKKYISSNKQAFSNPPQAKLLLIVAKNDSDKAKAEAALKSGQKFRDVAMQYSSVPNARQNGGAYLTTNISEMPQVLQQLVAQTPENHATPWEKNGANSVKFFVESKSGPKPIPVTADLVSAVQRELAKKKSPNGPDFQKRMIEKIKNSKVDLSVPFYQEGWKQYVMTSATATAPGAGAPPAPKGK